MVPVRMVVGRPKVGERRNDKGATSTQNGTFPLHISLHLLSFLSLIPFFFSPLSTYH